MTLHAVERLLHELNRHPPTGGLDDAGPGAEEIRAWAIAAAATSPGAAEALAYEAVDAWATGCAVVDLLPTGAGAEDR